VLPAAMLHLSSPRPGLGASKDCARDFAPQHRQNFLLEPGVALNPATVAPRGVRKRDNARRLAREFAPAANGLVNPETFRQRSSYSRKMVILGEAPNRENAFDTRQSRKQCVMPSLAAFAARRQVALVGIVTGKTKAHRHDRHPCLIIENLPRDAHPLPQTIARGVVEGQFREMHPDSRCLTGNEHPRCRRHTEYWTRLVRERAVARFLDAKPAVFYATGERREIGHRTPVRHGQSPVQPELLASLVHALSRIIFILASSCPLAPMESARVPATRSRPAFVANKSYDCLSGSLIFFQHRLRNLSSAAKIERVFQSGFCIE
jgi:hypothetical protein